MSLHLEAQLPCGGRFVEAAEPPHGILIAFPRPPWGDMRFAVEDLQLVPLAQYPRQAQSNSSAPPAALTPIAASCGKIAALAERGRCASGLAADLKESP